MRRFVFSLFLALGLSPIGAFADSAAPPPPEAPQEETTAKSLDKLYDRLAKTGFADEAAGILGEIDRTRGQSGSDTADLLMSRAETARGANLPLALHLLDAVVDLYPQWSEAWSTRATLRFQSGDTAGAMADLAQTLKRDSRDIGALAGLGAILTNAGDPDAALRVYDRALALAPAYEPIQQARARAQTALWRLSP
jgi:tetratricopeptide (TPR) repeat protein